MAIEAIKEPQVSRESAASNTHQKVFALLAQAHGAGKVLDIPCGSGAFLRRLVEGGYDAHGADLEPHPALPENAGFASADMNEPLPYEDASFDAVVSIEGIEHIQRPFDFVRECHRILKPEGLLILTTPNISSLRSRWRWFLTGFHNKGKLPLDEEHPEPRHHINLLSYPQLRYMLHTSGFRIVTQRSNRIKPISWVYLPCWPLCRLVNSLLCRKGAKNARQRALFAEITRNLYATDVAFGESLILVARKTADHL